MTNEMTPIAWPPKAPREVRDFAAKMLTAVEPLDPKGEPQMDAAQINEMKGLAALTVAAYYLSKMPDNTHRQTILERSIPIFRQ